MKTAILAIILFGLLIFPHELGHFIAAKKFNVKVNEFSFGMGPALYKKQKGETLYAIRLIPIGGYCAMEGEDGDSTDDRAFSSKKPWQKLIILVAGAFMNLVVCFVILVATYTIDGYTTTKIGDVAENSPAYFAGLEVNDRIIKVGDTEIKEWVQIGNAISKEEGNSVDIVVIRDGEEKTINVVPEVKYNEDGSIYGYMVGITVKPGHNPIIAIGYSFLGTGDMIGVIFDSLKMIFSGEATLNDMAGPVGIIQIVNETASTSIWSYLFLAALISVNVGMINLFPFPALDGGRIIFVLYTMITKKKVSEKVEGVVNAFGLILLLALFVIITGNDISRILG